MEATATKATAAPARKPNGPARSRERQPEKPTPEVGILSLQHVVGNRTIAALLNDRTPAHRPQLPPLGTGRPLDPPIQQRLERRTGGDLDKVRIHTDGRAAESARDLGALAYSTGPNVVFRPGEYQPWTPDGFDLLTHEAVHVIQSNAQPASNPSVEPAASSWEHQANQIATTPAHAASPISTGAPPAIRLRRDPQLEEALRAIQNAMGPFADERNKLVIIMTAVRHVDLNDGDNLQPITLAVRRRFGDETMVLFLTYVDQMSPERRIGQLTAGEAQHQQLMRLMQVQRRGPYGTYGGVAAPIVISRLPLAVPFAIAQAIAALPAALARLVRMVINLFRAAGAFLSGILDGLNASVSTADAKRLAERMLKSTVMSLIFAPVFLAGAVVGIVEDVVDTIRSVFHMVVNFRETASAMLESLKALLSSSGQEIAYKMGEEMGKSFASKIQELLKGGMVRFSYNLGRFVGPTIIYTILALLGIPELLGASIAARLMSVLRPLLQRFPRLMKLLEAIAKRIPRRRHRGPDVDIDPQLPHHHQRQLTAGDAPPHEHTGTHHTEAAPPKADEPAIPHEPPASTTPPGGGPRQPRRPAGGDGGGLPGTTGTRHLPRNYRMPRQNHSDFPATSSQIGTPQQRISRKVRKRGERVRRGEGEQGTKVTDIPGGRTGTREHWEEHGHEFPEYRSARQYHRGAVDFCRDPSTRRFYYRSPGGRPTIGYYNVQTNTFAATSVDGKTIYTYFRPDDVAHYVRNIRAGDVAPGSTPRHSVPTRR